VKVGIQFRLHQDGHVSDDTVADVLRDEVQRQGYGTFPTRKSLHGAVTAIPGDVSGRWEVVVDDGDQVHVPLCC